METLAAAGRPLTVPEILQGRPELPKPAPTEHDSTHRHRCRAQGRGSSTTTAASSSPRNFRATTIISSARTAGRWKTSTLAKTERALGEAARAVAEEQGYEVTEHQLDMVGLCATYGLRRPGNLHPRPGLSCSSS